MLGTVLNSWEAAENETDRAPRFLETYPPVGEMGNTLVKNCLLKLLSRSKSRAEHDQDVGTGRDEMAARGRLPRKGLYEEGTSEQRPEYKDPVFQNQER